MKAILINADERKITAVDAGAPNKSLERLRELIGCEWVQPAIIGENLTLWLDEEGRLKLPKPGFSLKDIPTDFAGNGVLLGGDADRARACKASPEVVALGVRWLAPRLGHVAPPPRVLLPPVTQTSAQGENRR